MPRLPTQWLSTQPSAGDPVGRVVCRRPQQPQLIQRGDLRVEFRNGVIELYSPYSPALVAALKAAVPYTDRAWSKTRRCWQVAPEWAEVLQQVVAQALGVDLQLPPSLPGPSLAAAVTRLLEVRYLGRVKQREDGSENAFGWCNGNWTVILPKAALFAWFGQEEHQAPQDTTLYGVLGVAAAVDAAALKSAYRKAARTWHPDVSTEPGTHERFLQIQRAYEILSDPVKRQRYNAGLALERSVKEQPAHRHEWEWQPPLRCGLILAEGKERLGRFVVERIVQWEDLTNERGEILVSSWELGADTFTEKWVMP